MLEYVKTILTKVSFQKELFEKELRKAIDLVSSLELPKLKEWCLKKFGNIYADIIGSTFKLVGC
ncbi:MAG: hypothetical protein LAT68_13135 [Cyclobacteriaceae bacterium]|nr:hypothetical protein [Cyclobacteriaceae bacterium]MCH8517265.1 hypothetical protein [Cyclobacteriaceae bacterium]